MTNFFKPMEARSATLYYINWLLENFALDSKDELTILASTFISECCKMHHVTMKIEDITSLEVKYFGNKEIHYVVNKTDLHIVSVDIKMDYILRMKELGAVDVVLNEFESLKEKYDAQNYYLTYLETGWTGDLLDIKNDGLYKVVMRNDLLTLLENTFTKNQISNEYIGYLKEIETDSQSYNTLSMSDWNWTQYKGLFRALQFTLNEGRGKINRQYGDLLYFDFFEKKVDGAIIYFRLEHNSDTIKVRACFDTTAIKKTDLKRWVKHVEDVASLTNIEFKPTQKKGREKCTTLGKISDSVFVKDKDMIDYTETVKNLQKYKVLFDSLNTKI